ncbi:MAG: hypothetical protein ILO36_08825, partial [Abditibacteriota bacterium]|nr:hypothetical protein [Abditibacteriota bacterium]
GPSERFFDHNLFHSWYLLDIVLVESGKIAVFIFIVPYLYGILICSQKFSQKNGFLFLPAKYLLPENCQ